MNKRIIISLSVIGLVAAIAIGGTMAYFNDTEVSTGNVFTAGSIDLKVDHTLATYNGNPCVSNCEETGGNLVINGGFEAPNVPTGGWAVYPNASLTSWTVESGAGLEIQDHAAGNPHGGNQLAELDSYNSSVISQTLATAAGGKYRLTFWYSPRPNRPAGDNTIGVDVKVVSNGAILVSDIVGAGSAGGSGTVWQKLVYDFIATDTSTKIIFSDLGTNNSYGGYLDDISVKELDCTSEYSSGGTCALWGEKNLEQGDTFWSFDDVKPADHGTNVVSLHVDSNNAYVCLFTGNLVDNENILTDPELALNDDSTIGELSQYLKLFAWTDLNGNGVYEPGDENVLVAPNTPINIEIVQLSLIGGSSANVGLAWCMGNQVVDDSGNISCSGAGNQDNAQTDSVVASVIAYAAQQRNNSDFNCRTVAAEYRQIQ